jgi:spore coat polysaccharide biosynthesis protein SpsF
MLKTLGIVEACYRCQSARSRACRKLGGKAVLEWVVRRATDCQRLGGVIVLTDQAPENAFVSGLVPLDVPVFLGKRPDPLACFAAALEEYPAEAVVRIGSAYPFIDPMLVDRLVIAAESQPDYDYVGYCSRDGRPAVLSPLGVSAEWIRTAALERAARRAMSAEDREAVTRYLYSRPEKFRVRLVPAPAQIDRDDVRLTVDMEEDWEHALTIFEALGPDELDWQRIASLLNHQPALRKRMAALNRAHARV